ncbi:amidase domain-containing protein [Solibacillus sp. FSL R7-0682]|uniref:amidase domain-containing protein n=2 Tax=unclassified Solibacillus TaxID=2637870 RepID=UPI0030F9462F
MTVLTLAIGIPAAQAKSSSTEIDSVADATHSSSVVETTFSLSKDILTNYYKNTDLGTAGLTGKTIMDTNLLDPKLSNYVEQKIKTKQYVTDAADAEKENYTLNFTLLSSEVTKEGVFLSISTEATFNYVGLKVESGFGEISNMFFKNTDTGFTLTDWYMPYDYYDEFVIGQVDNSSRFIYNSTSIDSNISQRQLELHDRIVDNFSVDREIGSEVSTAAAPAPSATLRSLNKKNIVTYARNNIKASPASGNGVVPYYDFSQISGNWDCTNFVSHALLAGGAVVYDTNGTGISSTGWYYRNLSNRSSSWSGVPNLHTFLVNNTTKGPAGTSITYRTFDWFSTNHPYEVGDILQFYLSGSYNNWRHSTIITEFYETSQVNVVGALVTGRTASGSYNNNQKAETIYPGDAKRVIKLIGYYN